jgi:hypothetical protein
MGLFRQNLIYTLLSLTKKKLGEKMTASSMVEQEKSPYVPIIQCQTIILLSQGSFCCTNTSEKLSKAYEAGDQENSLLVQAFSDQVGCVSIFTNTTFYAEGGWKFYVVPQHIMHTAKSSRGRTEFLTQKPLTHL